MRNVALLVIVIVCLYGLSSSGFTRGQSATPTGVSTASPTIVKIELSEKEPAPSGIPAQVTYWCCAGGGGESLPALNAIQWDTVPNDVVPPSNDNSELIACGYTNKDRPTGVLTYPSGQKEVVGLWPSYKRGITYANIDCWGYSLQWVYGMELGNYTLALESKDGRLTRTWKIAYPTSKTRIDLSVRRSETGDFFTSTDKHTELLMGFFPSETVNLRIYFTEIPGEADYVASRAIQVDKDGAALIEITVARSATFSIAGILVTVDGDNSPHLTPVASSIADNTLVASRPTNATDFRQYKSLWNGVNFKDMTSPGSQNYETSIDAKTVRSFSFTWCGDSPTRLQEIVAPLSVSFSIDDAKVPDSSILVLDEGNCRKWATILNGWKPGSTVALQIRYTLSKVIFDGTANYAAGDYVHQLKVHVR